ncbi:MAG TPA: terminase family protein [Candidatus Limnocylindrales bacterium]|nr:terminase family protein [Candidatus Limnocylindrales bacterium]
MPAGSVHYADHFHPDFGVLWRPPKPRAELETWSLEQLQKYKAARDLIDSHGAGINPVQGWSLPMWKRVQENWTKYNIHVMLGGNQSGKTTFGARATVWAAATIPEAETYCFHVTDKRSIDDQQRFIYEAIPAAIKNLPTKKGTHHSIQYSQKNGFTDGICILPPHPGCRRGGSINFFNYAQYAQNDQIIEGIKAHFIWADETIPMGLFDTLRYRLFTYHGRMLLTFTVIDGWNDTIEKILSRRRTLESAFVGGRINRKLPLIEESLSVDSCCIYYAWTEHNPWTDWNEFMKLNANIPLTELLARGYGVPTKSMSGVFTGFDREVHVVPHENIPFVKDTKYAVTRYMAIDPAGSKSWFMAWVAIDSGGTWWVYREYPDADVWAESSNDPDGKPGPAQKGSKFGIKDYVELIRDAEGEEQIYERYIDPRMGAAEKQSEEGATTIISDLDDQNMTVIPAPGVDEDNGLQLLKGLMRWDETKERDSLNSPRFFVSDRCQNIIFALSEYKKHSRKEATKDPIDALRYIAVSNPEYYELTDMKDDHPTGCY